MALKKKNKMAQIDFKPKLRGELEFKQKEFNFSEKQTAVLKCLLDDDTKIVFLSGVAGSSKAQPLDSLVMTPRGPIAIGDLAIGDSVCTPDGAFAKISGIFPQGNIDVFKISFSDGTSTECCGDHLWLTQTARDRNARGKTAGKAFKRPRCGSVKSTTEIKDSLIYRENHLNHSIPITKPVSFEKRDHIIHPYILGVLLGDGCILKNVRFSSADSEVAQRVSDLLPVGLSVKKRLEIEYCIVDEDANWKNPNKFTAELKRLDVFGHKSYEKFVPNEYLVDSVENRIELLRGLLDTDGHVTNPRGRGGNSTMFTTTSPKLAENVRFIVEGLGGTVLQSVRKNFYVYMGEKKQGLDSFSLCINLPPEINPFFLKRKADKVIPKSKYGPIRYITSIEKVGQKECQCILIDSKDHLYMTNNFIVTHNTYLSVYAALHLLESDFDKDILYIRTVQESGSKSLGYLPGDQGSKFGPFQMPLQDKVDEIVHPYKSKELFDSGKLQAIPVNYLRGASWKNKIVIIDEAQNFSFKETQTCLTRVGEGTKVFICGDNMQSDLPFGKSAFSDFIKVFDNEESREKGIFSFKFGKEDIVRSEILKFLIEKIESIPHKQL